MPPRASRDFSMVLARGHRFCYAWIYVFYLEDAGAKWNRSIGTGFSLNLLTY